MTRVFSLLVSVSIGCARADDGWRGDWSTRHAEGACLVSDTYAAFTDHQLVAGHFAAYAADDFKPTFTLTFHDSDVILVTISLDDAEFERHLRKSDDWVEFRLVHPHAHELMETLARQRSVSVSARTSAGVQLDVGIDRSSLDRFPVAYAMFKACVAANDA